MSHLLLVDKDPQSLLKNVESQLVREVQSTTTVAHPIPSGLARLVVAEVHAAQATTRPLKGFYQISQLSHIAKEMRAYDKSDVHKIYGKRDVNSRRKKPRQTRNPYKSRNYQPKQFQGNYYKCGCKGHLAKEYKAPSYIINMYRELQQFRN